jgi:hypothetical protein
MESAYHQLNAGKTLPKYQLTNYLNPDNEFVGVAVSKGVTMDGQVPIATNAKPCLDVCMVAATPLPTLVCVTNIGRVHFVTNQSAGKTLIFNFGLFKTELKG